MVYSESVLRSRGYLVLLQNCCSFVKKKEWCPLTTGPLMPTMTDSLPAPGREVLYKRRQPVEHVQLQRMKQDCNKGHPEKCSLEASIALCPTRCYGIPPMA